MVLANTAQARKRLVVLAVVFALSVASSGLAYFVLSELQYQLSSQELTRFNALIELGDTKTVPAQRGTSTVQTVIFDQPTVLPALAYPHSVSLGKPDRGALQSPAKLQPSSHFTVREGHNYGTQELIDILNAAGESVHAQHAVSPQLHVGDISLRDGGPFPPHWSHQSGCDVDLGYYLKKRHDRTTMGLATPRRLDVERTWTFLESMLLTGQVEYIFSDSTLIPILYREAKRRDLYTQHELNSWFGSGKGIIRHLGGHRDHLHIRVRPTSSLEAISAFIHNEGQYAVRRLLDRRPVFANVGIHDNWSTLANRYGVGLARLKRFNRIPEDFLLPEIGTRVIIGFQSPKHGYRSANPRLTGRVKRDI
jgi:hypothetical protein